MMNVADDPDDRRPGRSLSVGTLHPFADRLVVRPIASARARWLMITTGGASSLSAAVEEAALDERNLERAK